MDGAGTGVGHGMERKRRARECPEAPPPGAYGSCEVNDRGGRVCGHLCVLDVYWVCKKREVIGLLRDRVRFGDGASWGS